EPNVRAGFILIPDSGVSNAMYIAYSAPTKYGVYPASFVELVTNRIVVINTKEIVNSPMNAPALPYTPGTVVAYLTALCASAPRRTYAAIATPQVAPENCAAAWNKESNNFTLPSR